MNRTSRPLVGCCIVAVLAASAVLTRQAHSGAYIFAGDANGLDVITHPLGYTGAGGSLSISVGIDPTSANAAAMAISVQNIVNTFNGLGVTTGNLAALSDPTTIDFESVALHELGHSLGLAHVNAASESGLSGANLNYTKATNGSNNVFDLNAGVDTVIGSSDDMRGDDVNLFWFRMSDNNPFSLAPTVDSTTYSRDIGNLPGGHSFPANGDRTVAGLLGVPNTEAVMQQGTFFGEAQRTLTADGIATLRYGMAGVDELAGTADDYTIALTFERTGSADIELDFDTASGLASSSSNGGYINAPFNDHVAITATSIRFSNNFNWFFNDVASCGFSITPTSVSVASDATSSSLAVTADAGCAWTAVSNDAWVTVTGGASGTGNGTVSYSVAANAATERVGTVTIYDETFTVTQMSAFVFTDDPLVPNVTPLRAIHLMELRVRIDALLVGTYAWTDHPIVAGTTVVRWLHISELRAALDQAYAENSATHSGYTAGGGASTPVRAIHINELRQFVKDLEAP